MNALFKVLAAVAVSVTVFAGDIASAASTLYTNRADWQAAAGTPVTIDFATLDTSAPITNPPGEAFFSTLVLKEVTFQSVISYFNEYLIVDSGSTTVSLPANLFSFAFDLSADFTGNYTVTLSTGETFSGTSTEGAPLFFGVKSTAPVTGLTISYDNGLFRIDDFAYVQTTTQQVNIDIVPGSTLNPVKAGSSLPLPVAILSTATFDAATVSVSTVRFGKTGVEAAPTLAALLDVNGDKRKDLVLTFNTKNTGIVFGDTRAVLKGKTKSGQSIEGSGSIKTVR